MKFGHEVDWIFLNICTKFQLKIPSVAQKKGLMLAQKNDVRSCQKGNCKLSSLRGCWLSSLAHGQQPCHGASPTPYACRKHNARYAWALTPWHPSVVGTGGWWHAVAAAAGRPTDFPAVRGQVGMIKRKPLTHVVGSECEYMMPFTPIG